MKYRLKHEKNVVSHHASRIGNNPCEFKNFFPKFLHDFVVHKITFRIKLNNSPICANNQKSQKWKTEKNYKSCRSDEINEA